MFRSIEIKMHLDYVQDRRLATTNAMRRLCVFVAFALAGIVIAARLPVRTTTTEIDAISGSVRHTNVWIGGYRSTSLEIRPLATRLLALNIPWTRDWREVGTAEYDLFGVALSRACGVAPPIILLHQDLFVHTSSAAQLREFAGKMQGGSEDERSKVVEDAIERSLGIK